MLFRSGGKLFFTAVGKGYLGVDKSTQTLTPPSSRKILFRCRAGFYLSNYVEDRQIIIRNIIKDYLSSIRFSAWSTAPPNNVGSGTGSAGTSYVSLAVVPTFCSRPAWWDTVTDGI